MRVYNDEGTPDNVQVPATSLLNDDIADDESVQFVRLPGLDKLLVIGFTPIVPVLTVLPELSAIIGGNMTPVVEVIEDGTTLDRDAELSLSLITPTGHSTPTVTWDTDAGDSGCAIAESSQKVTITGTIAEIDDLMGGTSTGFVRFSLSLAGDYTLRCTVTVVQGRRATADIYVRVLSSLGLLPPVFYYGSVKGTSPMLVDLYDVSTGALEHENQEVNLAAHLQWTPPVGADVLAVWYNPTTPPTSIEIYSAFPSGEILVTEDGNINFQGNTEVTFNDDGDDVDFRVESGSNAFAFMVDAGANTVGVGGSAFGTRFSVSSILCVVNEQGADSDFRVEGDTATHLLFCDAGLDAFQVGDTTAGTRLHMDNTTTTFNEGGTAIDFRIETPTLDYMFFLHSDVLAENVAFLTPAEPNWQSMDRGIFIGTATVEPAGNPTSGAFLWANSGGVIHTRSTAGVVKAVCPAPDIQIFTATGESTWTKPAGAVSVQVHLIGGGGGGGSGRVGGSSTTRGSGGGGGGGGYSADVFLAASLDPTETVTVGAGGAGGASVGSSTDTDGNAGANGEDTTFGTYLTGSGGAGGGAGTNSAGGAGGSGGAGDTQTGGAGALGNTGGGAGGTLGGSVAAPRMAGAGGGGGGGISSAGVGGFSAAGGASGGQRGDRGFEAQAAPAGSIASLPGLRGHYGQANLVGTSLADWGGGGGGGGGGSASTAANTAHHGFGASGGNYGGGGGGGPGATNGMGAFNAGGSGGAGVAIIVTFFELA